MADTLLQTVENQPIENDKLGLPFVEIINSVGKHFNHTSADSESTRFNRDPKTGDTVIGIHSRATAKDILQLLKGETNTDISDFGRRLKDIGILLSREKVVQDSIKASEFAKSVYLVGCSIRNEETTGKIILTTEKLSNESQEYKDELFLWAIGRDNPDSTYARNLHNSSARPHPVESDLFGIKIVEAQRDIKSKRAKDTLRKKALFIRSFVNGLEEKDGKLSEQTKEGLEKTYLSAARQAAINILTQNAWSNWEHNLRIPPTERHKYFDNQILQIFEKIPGFREESLRIVEAVEVLSKSEGWNSLSEIGKVRDIWDVCQTYKYADTFKPTKALDTGELECQLKTFLAGNLLRKYIPEVKKAAWYEEGHVKLALQVQGTNYMFDSSFQKENGADRYLVVTNNSKYYTSDGIGVTEEINNTLNQVFKTGIESTIPTESKGYMSVGDFDKTVVSGILLNISNITDYKLAVAILRLVIDINPNFPTGYLNLGARLSIVESKRAEVIELYRKVIEISPNSPTAYYNLGLLFTGEEALKMFRKSVDVDPTFSKGYYKLGELLSGEESLKNYRKAYEVNPKLTEALYMFAFTVSKDVSLETYDNVREALICIDKYIDLVKDDPKESKLPHFTLFIPKLKGYLEQRLINLIGSNLEREG